MSGGEGIVRYDNPAGGWGALKALGEHLVEQRHPGQGHGDAAAHEPAAGLRLPRLRLADPKHTSSFEFCENGGKAVAWEATAKRCTPEFFAAHTVARACGLERLRARDGGPPHAADGL